MTEADQEFSSQLGMPELGKLTNEQALDSIAHLVDSSGDLKKVEGIQHAINLAGQLLNRGLTGEQLARCHYYTANAWSHRRSLRTVSTSVWEWESEETEEEVFHLRSALDVKGLSILPPDLLCRILTNLGNLMSWIGRVVEAFGHWNEALERSPSFAMALGSRGIGLTKYAESLYDRGHSLLLLQQAHTDLVAVKKYQLHQPAQQAFDRYRAHIESMMTAKQLDHQHDLDSSLLGSTKGEIRYRQWCLVNCLFLNPLNDLGPRSVAARDVFSVPSVVVPISEGPYYHGFFNQMKQEYVSARYLFYASLQMKRPHFADREVLLHNTLDYPTYSLAAEKAKASFRAAYAILDKIAYFLNHYLRLSIPDRRVSFRTLWYVAQDRKQGLRPEFNSLDNWPLRGLFWLSKDLCEDKPGFSRSMDPTGTRLANMRNHLEHKYLKLHDSLWAGPPDPGDETSLRLADTLAYSLRRQDFEDQTLKLLRVIRAGLIYLSLAVHREERRKAGARKSDRVVPMPLDIIEDQWKV